MPNGAGRQDRLDGPEGDPRARAPGAAGHHRGAAARRRTDRDRVRLADRPVPERDELHLKAWQRWGIVEAGRGPRGRQGPSLEGQGPRHRGEFRRAAAHRAGRDRGAGGVHGPQPRPGHRVPEHQAGEPREWWDIMELGNGDYWLTAGELAEISASATRRPRTLRATPALFAAGRKPAGADSAPHRAARQRVIRGPRAGRVRPGGTGDGSAGPVCCDGRTRCGTWPAQRRRTGAAPRRRCCSAPPR